MIRAVERRDQWREPSQRRCERTTPAAEVCGAGDVWRRPWHPGDVAHTDHLTHGLDRQPEFLAVQPEGDEVQLAHRGGRGGGRIPTRHLVREREHRRGRLSRPPGSRYEA
jgi:hypothetical protein